MISFRCHSCGKAYQVKSEHGGKTINCPGCRVPIVLPYGMAVITVPLTPAPLRKTAFVKQGPDTALVLTAVLFGLPLLAIIVWLGFALVFSPSKEVRERTGGAPDNRRAWRCLSYKSIYTQKDERTWIETYSDTGKFKFEMEYKGRTDDYIELFIAAKGELIRLYNDRIEAKQERGWAAFGTGHWDSVGQNTSIANRSVNEKQNQSRIAEEEKQRQAAEKANNGRGVTLKAYYEIKMGMKYEEVYAIIGQHGVELSSISLEEIDIHMLQWSDGGLFSGTMMLQFENGRVASRSQFGLR